MSSATPEQRVLIEECLARGVRFFWTGPGALLIARSGVSDVIRNAIAGGAEVLGFEGFELDGPWIRPRLDLIYDAESRPDISDPLEVIAIGQTTDGSTDASVPRVKLRYYRLLG